MAASGSRVRGEGSSLGAGAAAGGGDAALLELDTLTTPSLAHLPAADLVARLRRDDIDGRRRSGSAGPDFADVALVVAVRERRLAEAEDRVRAADAVAAGLRDTIRALELRAANAAEALARKRKSRAGAGSGGGGERVVAAREDDDDQSQAQAGLEKPQIGADGEIRVQDLTAGEVVVAVPEVQDGEQIDDGEITPGNAGVMAMAAEVVGDNNMPRPSPLTRGIGAARPAASFMMPEEELAEERAVERVVAVRSSHDHEVVDSREEVPEEVVGRKRKEPAAAVSFAPAEKAQERVTKKPKKLLLPYTSNNAVDLSVDKGKGKADEVGCENSGSDTDTDSEVEEAKEGLCLITEAQGWERLNKLKAQFAAWESEYDAANADDAAQGTLQPAAQVPMAVDEAEARERSESTIARLQEEIIICAEKLEEVKDHARKTVKRLCAEITKYYKDMAKKTEEHHCAELTECKEKAKRLCAEITEYKERTKKTEKHHYAEITEYKDRAKKIEERLCAEITKCEENAKKTEERLSAEIEYKDKAKKNEKRLYAEINECRERAKKTEERFNNDIIECKKKAKNTEERLCAKITEYNENAKKTEERLHAEIIEHKDNAKKTEERLCTEINECKKKATETEAVLWEEILLAHISAVTEREVWKYSAAGAQAHIEAWKHKASETETRLQTRDENVARLENKVAEGECKLSNAERRIRVFDDFIAHLEEKIEASEKDRATELDSHFRQATKMEDHLLAKIGKLELKVANLETRRSSGISRGDHSRSVAIVEDKAKKTTMHKEVPAAAGGTNKKKAQRQKGVSFYDTTLKNYMEEQKLKGNEENEESLRKKAAAVASKKLYHRCCSHAPLSAQLGSPSVDVEGSGKEA